MTNKLSQSLTAEETKKYNLWIWKLFIGGFLCIILFLFLVSLGFLGSLPSFRDIEHPKSNLASEVIADGGKVMGSYFVQNRSNVDFKQISPYVINALIATEDTRFHQHSGVDFKRTFSIVLYNLVGKKQGASTITQQLALNLFSQREKNIFKRMAQKFKEIITAIKLERNYTKEEIITMYLNTVDFGNQAYGIKSAARVYFNTTPDKLSLTQAATLIGMLKGITLYSPVKNPQNALKRRNLVMYNMVKNENITEEDYTNAKNIDLGLKFNSAALDNGIAPYFRTVMKTEIKKLFEKHSITKANGNSYDLDRDGLKIYTTINYDMQLYAEAAQKEYMTQLQAEFNRAYKGKNVFYDKYNLISAGMKRSDRYAVLKAQGLSDKEILEQFKIKTQMTVFTWKGDKDTVMSPLDSIKYNKLMLRNAFMAMDPHTGQIKAWVGGIDFKYYKYDQVSMGARQVGSTAKPFTYVVAIENGYSPCLTVPNVPVTITQAGSAPWTPRSSGTVRGNLTLSQALAFSQNYITAYVMKQVGAPAVANLIKKLGISTQVPVVPSICLGSFDATLFDMVGAYGAFVNKGIWTEPNYITKITDKNGIVLYQRQPIAKPVLNEEVAYVMTSMLKNVVNYGTGKRLRYKYNIQTPIGGKTGTTNENSDGWFMGVTPDLVAGVWTGCEDRAIHFTSTSQGEGANTALPIFALFMKKVYANPKLKISKNDFEIPKTGIPIVMDCNQYYGDPSFGGLEGGDEEENSSQNRTEVDKRLGF